MLYFDNFFYLLRELTPREDPEYSHLQQLEALLLEDLRAAAGEELVEKLTDVREELAVSETGLHFLLGLRLGLAALDL